MELREALNSPISDFTSENFAQIAKGDTISSAAASMKKSGTTEAIVVDGGRPIGIVTERDILYKVVAAGSDPSKVKVGDVMSSPVQTVEEGSKVSEAIAMMTKMGIRRLGVTSKGKLVGIVTQRAMVSGSVKEHVALPELAVPGQLRCPYCDAIMKDKDELSRHIDQVHLGPGLLEGNKSNW